MTRPRGALLSHSLELRNHRDTYAMDRTYEGNETRQLTLDLGFMAFSVGVSGSRADSNLRRFGIRAELNPFNSASVKLIEHDFRLSPLALRLWHQWRVGGPMLDHVVELIDCTLKIEALIALVRCEPGPVHEL